MLHDVVEQKLHPNIEYICVNCSHFREMNILVKENMLLANQWPTNGDTIPEEQSFDS